MERIGEYLVQRMVGEGGMGKVYEAEERLSKRDLHCPVCRASVESSFLVCPVCTTRLKQACVKCNAPLEALWQICPHCATPVSTPNLPGIDDTIADSWTAPRKRAAESD